MTKSGNSMGVHYIISSYTVSIYISFVYCVALEIGPLGGYDNLNQFDTI